MNLRSARVQLLITLGATAAIAAVGELGLRTAGVRFDATFYAPDRQLGWALRPGVEGWFVSEGSQFVRINSDGMRAREYAIHKSPNTIRIAVLGNSWTEALQVPVEKTFCSILERRLSGSPCASGRNVEVLNFGVSGYATAQELLQLRTRIWKYDPDIVLVAFYTLRDVLNNIRRFNSAANPAQSPYFVFAGDRLVLDDAFRNLPQIEAASSFRARIRGDVADRLRLFQAANRLVRLLRIGAAKATMSTAVATAPRGLPEDAIYAPPASTEIAEAWNVTEGLLLLVRDEVAAHNAALLIVTLANRTQTHPDITTRQRYMERLGVSSLDYADQRIRAFGASSGIRVTSLAQRLAARASENGTFLNGFPNTASGEGHWNEIGHQAAGDAIADDVCSLLQGGGAPPGRIATSTARR